LENSENYVIINETVRGGFKITAYIEDLPPEERKKRDIELVRTASKLLRQYSSEKNKKSFDLHKGGE